MDEPLPTGHGAEDEPHFRESRRSRADPTERIAEQLLRSEARREDPTGHEVQQSVHEELHTLYTARDQATGGWADWYLAMRARVTPAQSWLAVLLTALLGGPLAILGALWATRQGIFTTVVFAPTVEEVLKVGLLAIAIETRPYLWRSVWQLRLVAVLSALSFSVVENLLYLFVYLDAPSSALVVWRWTVCTALHVVASLIAAEGLVRTWRRTEERFERPRLDHAYGWLLLAIVLHGAYNLAVTVFQPV